LSHHKLRPNWGGENQVIFAQKLIPFLFRIEKLLSKNRYLNNHKKINN